MRKFSQVIPALHEAQGTALSDLQKSYQEYFTAKLTKFGVKSPAELDADKKSEFFSEISKDWEKGQGATKAGKADVDEHGVKESETVNELKASDLKPGKKYKSDSYGEVTFIRLNPDGKTMKLHSKETGDVTTDLFNATGMTILESEESLDAIDEAAMADVYGMAKDSKDFASFVKEFTKKYHDLSAAGEPGQFKEWLQSIWDNRNLDEGGGFQRSGPSAEATRKAEQLKKLRALRAHSEEQARMKKAQQKRARAAANEGEVTEANTPEIPKDNDPNQIYVLSGKAGYFKVKDNKWDLIGLRKPEGVTDKDIIILKESEVNEGKEIKSESEFKEYAMALLKKAHPDDFDEKKANDTIEGILKKCDGDFGACVGMITSSLGEAKVNEGDMTKDYDGFIVLDSKTKKTYKFKYVKGTSNVKVENDAIAKLVKSIGSSQANFMVHGFVKKGEWNSTDSEILESVVNEAEIKSESEFKEYATAILKKAHPDDFDEKKANDTIDGILKKCDGDFGAAVGMITSSLGEAETCPMCKKDPCECYTAEGNNDDLNEAEDISQYYDEVKKALPQLEDLIKKKLGFSPKLTAEQKGNVKIEITSNDLTNELGKTLVKTLFTKIAIGFWGGNVTGDGKSIWFNPKVWYEHPSGGSNGCDFIWDSLWWDLASKKWVEGRSIIK
jgi:hypothetical protein